MLAEEDARVTLVGRSADALASQAEAIGSQASTIAIDVCDPDAIAQIAAAGPFDALVNNAGASVAQPLIDVSEADWQRQWDLNVMVPLRLTQALAPEMVRRGWGRIVNVSSSAGKRPTPMHHPYSVTKAAQLSLSRVLAEEYAGTGVLVNAVAPGPVASPFWMEAGGTADQLAAKLGVTREEIIAGVEARTPLGRFGTPEELAAVIVFLCSSQSGFVTGSAWSADGGATATIM